MEKTSRLKKGVVLISILVLPSVLYILMTTGKHDFIYLPTYGDERVNFEVDRIDHRIEDSLHYHLPTSLGLTNLESGESTILGSFPEKISLIQLLDPKEDNQDQEAIFFKMNQQMIKELDKFPSFQLLTILPPVDSNYQVNRDLFGGLDISSPSWLKMSTVDQESFVALRNQLFVGGSTSIMNAKPEQSFRYIMILDKELSLRCGLDKNGKLIYTYDGSREDRLRLLVGDVKVLMAEYLKEVKKNAKK